MGLLDNALQAIKNQYQETKGNIGLLMSDPRQYMSKLNQEAAEYNRLSSLAAKASMNEFRGLPITPEQAAAKEYIDQKQMDLALGFTGSIKPTKAFINEAQQTAAINAEKMLGLPTGNTAMDRAKALGYEIPAFRGVREEVKNLSPVTYSTNLPEGASMYAGSGTGANVMPLLIRSKNPYVAKDYGDIGLFSEKKANELKKAGFDSAMFTQQQKGGSPYIEYVSIDPSNVRSRFAAFDPARAKEADLLAGVVPLGLLAGQEQLEMKKEKKPKK
jgi:hypothetical protein